MYVQSVQLEKYQETPSLLSNSVSKSDFKQLFDKITGGEVAQEIKATYDVTLNIGTIANVDTLLSDNDIRCKNMVCISPGTLEKMDQDPKLKKKILSAIEEFCSIEEQAKVNALQPPVKSAGMIVYPNGDAIYWLEGYSTNIDEEKGEQRIITEAGIDIATDTYGQLLTWKTESNSDQVMSVLASSVIREKLRL